MNGSVEGRLPIRSEGDVIAARRSVRAAASALGFGLTDLTRIVTTVSELTRNILHHAGEGSVRWRSLAANGRTGMELVFEDGGPGIADLEMALQEGYTSGSGLGMGLPGSKRLMDELEIDSEVGRGTTVTARKWLR